MIRTSSFRWGLGLLGSPRAKKFDVFLSVTLLNGKICEQEIAIMLFDVIDDFDVVG